MPSGSTRATAHVKLARRFATPERFLRSSALFAGVFDGTTFTAYANGEVYVFSGDAASLLSRAGARLPESLELLAKIMDPESFINEDPTDVVGVKYYNDSYCDDELGYLRYVKAQGLLEWQRSDS